MHILFLSDPSSPHTIKWTTYLKEKGIKISIFGLNRCDDRILNEYTNKDIHIFTCKVKRRICMKNSNSLLKLQYLFYIKKIRRIIKVIKPDIVHAHYATSYGLLGILSRFHPIIISLWGTDVYDFPNNSFAHKAVFKYILSNSDKILSTSNAMKYEAAKYTNKCILTIPFGIDTSIFKPKFLSAKKESDCIRIGTIKNLEAIHGIDNLIRSFHIVQNRHPAIHLKLLIVGNGSQKSLLQELVKSLQLDNNVAFLGNIPYDMILKFYQNISIYMNLTKSESFGVAVLEASSCGIPVVVSNVGGLPEIIEDGKNGFVVPYGNIIASANALEKLVINRSLREEMGKYGRERVKKYYELSNCIDQMINIYKNILIR